MVKINFLTDFPERPLLWPLLYFQPPSFPQSFNNFSKFLCFIEVFLCLNISNSKYLSKLYFHLPPASNKLCYPPDQICGFYNPR